MKGLFLSRVRVLDVLRKRVMCGQQGLGDSCQTIDSGLRRENGEWSADVSIQETDLCGKAGEGGTEFEMFCQNQLQGDQHTLT